MSNEAAKFPAGTSIEPEQVIRHMHTIYDRLVILNADAVNQQIELLEEGPKKEAMKKIAVLVADFDQHVDYD